MLVPMVSHDQKCHVLHFDVMLALTVSMLFASCDADASVNGIIWPENSYYTSLLSSWPKNIMMPFMMHLASHDTDTDVNCILWHQYYQCHHVMPVAVAIVSHEEIKPCCFSFWLSWCKECSDDNANGIMWCQHQCQWHDMSEKSCYTSLQSSWDNKYNAAIDIAISITCCLCECQWQHMTKKVILHLISIIFT